MTNPVWAVMWTRWHNADNTHPPAPAASVVLPTALKSHVYEYSHDKAHTTFNKAICIRTMPKGAYIRVAITILPFSFLLQTHYVTVLG